MTDIVHLLRHRPQTVPFVPLGHQAADEIERLRTEIAKLRHDNASLRLAVTYWKAEAQQA